MCALPPWFVRHAAGAIEHTVTFWHNNSSEMERVSNGSRI